MRILISAWSMCQKHPLAQLTVAVIYPNFLICDSLKCFFSDWRHFVLESIIRKVTSLFPLHKFTETWTEVISLTLPCIIFINIISITFIEQTHFFVFLKVFKLQILHACQAHRSYHTNHEDFHAAPHEEPLKDTKQQNGFDFSRFDSIVVGLLVFCSQPASNVPASKGRTQHRWTQQITVAFLPGWREGPFVLQRCWQERCQCCWKRRAQKKTVFTTLVFPINVK